jgi:Mg-chelatase subunit ChlD
MGSVSRVYEVSAQWCLGLRKRALVLAIALTAALLVAIPQQASAVTRGTYSAPNWFPLRGGHLVGCAYLSTGPNCGGTYHEYWAIDIKGAKGEAAYAAGAGEVKEAVKNQGGNCNFRKIPLKACPDGSRGNYVLIDHGSGVFSYYTHFSSVTVGVGDWVDENTQIGTIGDSGWSDPGFYHLHFERRPVQSPRPGVERSDPGPLKACVGKDLKTYPQAFGVNTWQGLPGHKFIAHSDGTSCVRSGGGGGGGGRPKVDLVFAIDTTGSMWPYINGVKVAARGIAAGLFRLADARVALVDYKDLYASCPSDGYAARLDLPFSTDGAAFSAAVASLGAGGGCDFPESVYSGLMTAIRLPWRDGVTKAIIVMGDAPPHDPEPTTGFTRSSVSKAAIAVDPAAIYSININGGGSPYFEGLASDTGGQTYEASDPSTAVEQITTAITTITESALVADAGGPYSGTDGEPITFDASASSAPEGAAIVSYEWDFDGNGTYDLTTALPTASHVYSAPLSGTVGLRVTTDQSPPETAIATSTVQILKATELRYAGRRRGTVGHKVYLRAFLEDSAGHRVAGTSVKFSLGTQSCTANTNKRGKASCVIVARQSAGTYVAYAEATPPAPYFPSAVAATFKLLQPH